MWLQPNDFYKRHAKSCSDLSPDQSSITPVYCKSYFNKIIVTYSYYKVGPRRIEYINSDGTDTSGGVIAERVTAVFLAIE